jgi:hypothetical protein
MERTPITSPTIAAISFEPAADCPDEGALEIEFVNGDRYRFHDVPLKKFEAFQLTPAPDKFYAGEILNHYASEKLPSANIHDTPTKLEEPTP